MNKFLNRFLVAALLTALSAIAHANLAGEKVELRTIIFPMKQPTSVLIEVRYYKQSGANPAEVKSGLGWAYMRAVNNLPTMGWGCDVGKKAIDRDSQEFLTVFSKVILERKTPITPVGVVFHCYTPRVRE